MQRNEKVILTDVDGVLLDWVGVFSQWMIFRGYRVIDKGAYCINERYDISSSTVKTMIDSFHNSPEIGELPSVRDSIKYVKKLHNEFGYVFHVITSLSSDPEVQKLRKKNLEELFGTTIFGKFVFLETLTKKDVALEAYRDTECLWVEDNIENAECGQERGLRSIIMDQPYNQQSGNFVRVNNWKEIYEMVSGT